MAVEEAKPARVRLPKKVSIALKVPGEHEGQIFNTGPSWSTTQLFIEPRINLCLKRQDVPIKKLLELGKLKDVLVQRDLSAVVRYFDKKVVELATPRVIQGLIEMACATLRVKQ